MQPFQPWAREVAKRRGHHKAVLAIANKMAITAGYMNRKNDPPPSYQKIWGGYIRLVTMSQAYELTNNRVRDGWLYQKLGSD